MAGFAVVGGIWMTAGLTLRNSIVVAAYAGSENFIMIHRAGVYRCPARREFLMASIAGIGAVYVACILAAGRAAIVTADTVTGECRMVRNSRRCPGIGCMAAIALQRGGNMIAWFTTGGHVVVTA